MKKKKLTKTEKRKILLRQKLMEKYKKASKKYEEKRHSWKLKKMKILKTTNKNNKEIWKKETNKNWKKENTNTKKINGRNIKKKKKSIKQKKQKRQKHDKKYLKTQIKKEITATTKNNEEI